MEVYLKNSNRIVIDKLIPMLKNIGYKVTYTGMSDIDRNGYLLLNTSKKSAKFVKELLYSDKMEILDVNNCADMVRLKVILGASYIQYLENSVNVLRSYCKRLNDHLKL